MNTLKDKGEQQNFPNPYYCWVMEMSNEGYRNSAKVKVIPRIFEDDSLQLKFQEFITKCDEDRTLVAFEDLIEDLKSGAISINDDWSEYSNPENFYLFEDGSIRWAVLK